jgi:kumamolisin
MVPDCAANADPNTGYNIVLNGQVIVVGGTSAVAPLMSGFAAACGPKLGFISPELWANAPDFNDITIGDNGVYHAQVGPDPCTGLGSPIGTLIANLIATQTPSPQPQPQPVPVQSQLLAEAQLVVAITLASLPSWPTLADAQQACADALAALPGWPTP